MNILEKTITTTSDSEFEILKLKSIVFDIINEQELLNIKYQELEKIKSDYVEKLKEFY
jgi:hypothetical protein